MVVSNLSAAEATGANNAVNLRRASHADDGVESADMGLMFRTAQKSADCNPIERMSLFSEAVADYVVQQNDRAGYISQEKADWFVAKLREVGGIATASEFAMLIDMMKRAFGVPPSLSAFAIHEIETAIVSGRRNAIGSCGDAVGAVTISDVEVLRSVLYAPTTGSVNHVTREEAEALFDIAHATANGACDASFDDLFARAVGNYLTALCWHEQVRDRALRRERWLDKRETFFLFLPEPRQDATCHELTKSPLDWEQEVNAVLEREDAAARAESGQITGAEPSWVIAHLVRHGPLTSAEVHLLEWLGDRANALPPKLRALIEMTNDVRAYLLMKNSFLRGAVQSPHAPHLAH